MASGLIRQTFMKLDKDLSFHKVYYAEECLQPSEFIAQYPKSTLC